MYSWIAELLAVIFDLAATIYPFGASDDDDKNHKTAKAIIIIPLIIMASAFVFSYFISPMQKKRNTKDKLRALNYLLLQEKEDTEIYPIQIDDLARRNPTYGDLTVDSWENPFYYKMLANGNDYTLISKGEDGKLYTEDDIQLEEE